MFLSVLMSACIIIKVDSLIPHQTQNPLTPLGITTRKEATACDCFTNWVTIRIRPISKPPLVRTTSILVKFIGPPGVCPHIRARFRSRPVADRAYTPTFLGIDTTAPSTNPFAAEGRTLATRFVPGGTHRSCVEEFLGSRKDGIWRAGGRRDLVVGAWPNHARGNLRASVLSGQARAWHGWLEHVARRHSRASSSCPSSSSSSTRLRARCREPAVTQHVHCPLQSFL